MANKFLTKIMSTSLNKVVKTLLYKIQLINQTPYASIVQPDKQHIIKIITITIKAQIINIPSKSIPMTIKHNSKRKGKRSMNVCAKQRKI